MNFNILQFRDTRTPELKAGAQDIEDKRTEAEFCRRVRENIKARVIANPAYLRELRS